MVVSMLLTLITIVANNQRDQAIRDLTERDAEYSTLIEFSPVLMVRYGTDRRITFVNEAVSLTTGLPRKKIIGQPIDEFLPPPTGASRRRQASGFGNVIPAMSFEIEHQVAERLLQIRWVVRELHDDAGNVTETHCVGIDLTEQKQAEERRRVFEEQLVQVQKLESLGILAGGIAHDFNNLLAAMGGFAELAERHLPANHAARPALTGVRDAVDRAAGLARQMLAYAGKGQTTEHVAIDLNHELHGTLRLTAAALSKNVTVQLELHPSLPCVFGDVTQIRQVLLNLIINAGEAIGDSPGRLTIRTALYQLSADELGESVIDRELSPGEYIRVDVIDTGCGMDEATKERIFDPFFTTKFTGRGLGLASVLGIVRGHKGTVRVKSRKNVGTNFSILLPADRTRTVPSPASAVPAAIAPAGQKRGPTALVVDDEQSIRMITTQMLEQLGWSVVTAADGCEAIDVFRSDSEKFNVVLLDMTMPKMNGQEVYQELRRIRREVPVIVCSGYSQDSMNFTSDAQAPQFLPKPFRFDDLKRAVAAAI
jgi:PAS domain S-box-containing protein